MKQDRSTYWMLSACCILFLLQFKINFCFLSFVEGTINLNSTILIDTKNNSSDKPKIVDGSSDDNVIEKSGENSGCDQSEESGENNGSSKIGESEESSKQHLEPDLDNESNLYKILSVINNSTCNNKFAHARLKVKKVDWDELFEDSKVRCWQLIQLYNTSTKNVTDEQYFEVVFKVPLVPLSIIVGTGVDFSINEPGITNQNKTLNTSNLSPFTFCGTLPFCDNSANSACINTTIKNCNKCSLVNGILFMLILIILGLVISIGNMLIIAVVYRRHRKKKIDKIDIIKMSLAIADLLTGKYNLLKNLLLQTYYKRFIKLESVFKVNVFRNMAKI